MNTFLCIILIWAAVLIVFYLGVWFEYAYYRHNLPKKFNALVEAFTEEGEE